MKLRLLACVIDSALVAAGGSALWAVMWSKSASQALFIGGIFFALWFAYDLWRSQDEAKPLLGRLVVRSVFRDV
jgi:arginine exporter protein ArgO